MTVLFNAQTEKKRVGINTNAPKATLDVSIPAGLPATQPQGVSLPNMTSAQRSAFTSVERGTLIYNTDKKCTEIYEVNGAGVGEWNCIPAVGSVHTQTITVLPSGFEGEFFTKSDFTKNKVHFTLYNNTVAPLTAVNFASSVSFTPNTIQVAPSQNTAVTINAGANQKLSYTLQGASPIATGKYTANFSYGKCTASQSIEVRTSPDIDDVKKYIASMVYMTQNIKGEINNTKKLTIKIPWKNGIGPYKAVSIKKTAVPGLGGDVNNLTLDIPAGDFGTTPGASGELTATITVDGDGVYRVDQKTNTEWDIAVFPITINGEQFNISIKGVSGIPDRCFNKTNKECAGGHSWLSNDYDHQFVYMPIVGPDGKTWLNNILGAGYSNIEGKYTNPSVAVDGLINTLGEFGSLFQWNRKADGHEIYNLEIRSAGVRYTPKRGIVLKNSTSTWTNAGTDKQIYANSYGEYNWANSLSNTNRWDVNGENNPCPVGYHVPNYNDIMNIIHTKCSTTPTMSGIEEVYICNLPHDVRKFFSYSIMGHHTFGFDNNTFSIGTEPTVYTNQVQISGSAVSIVQGAGATTLQNWHLVMYRPNNNTFRTRVIWRPIYGLEPNLDAANYAKSIRCIKD